METERTVWGPRACFEGDWGIVVLCTMFLVSSSINVSIFHSMWLDTFWTNLVEYPQKESQALQPKADHWRDADQGSRGNSKTPVAEERRPCVGFGEHITGPPVTPSTRKNLGLQENYSLGWASNPLLCDCYCDLALSPGWGSGVNLDGFMIFL